MASRRKPVCFKRSDGDLVAFMARKTPTSCRKSEVYDELYIKKGVDDKELRVLKDARGKPNLAQLVGTSPHGGRHVAFIKHAGKPLMELTREERKDIRYRQNIRGQVTKAVKALRDIGYRHEDLAPRPGVHGRRGANRNILYDKETGRFTLIDFGKMSKPSRPYDVKGEVDAVMNELRRMKLVE